MKFATTSLLPIVVLASFSAISSGSDELAEARKLRASADIGDPDATMAFATYLDTYAPEPGALEHVCDGKSVSPFKAKKLKAQGQDCKSFESEENKKRVEEWRSVGLKSDSLYWYFKAAEYGDPAAIGIRCAVEKNPPDWLKESCDWLEEN